MHLQFFTKRQFIIGKKDVIKVVRGADKDKQGNTVVSNRTIVDLSLSRAKFMLEKYPRECETWGPDAIAKKEVKKAKNALPKSQRESRDIA